MGSTPDSLINHLRATPIFDARTALCISVLPGLIDAIGDIANILRKSQHVSLAGTSNKFGDDQLNVDVLCEERVRTAIAACPSVAAASSEEDPQERAARDGEEIPQTPSSSEQYTIAFDPLDGSSIIAPNWTVGTIIGIWDGRTALKQSPVERQIGAVLGVYGPRTTAIVALRVPGTEPICFEIGIGENGSKDCEVVRPTVKYVGPPFKTRYFAPANLRAAAQDNRYLDLINHYVQNNYTLRYSGGLVPDVVHALVKGHGIYISPVTGLSKAKLRRLYELYPIALIVECAGGKAIDPADGKDVLSRVLNHIDETAGLVCGTIDEVEFVWASLVS